MSDLSAILSVVNLFIHGFNDASNLFGQKKSVASYTAFGNLIPDVVAVSGNIGNLPNQLKSLKVADVATIVESVAQNLNVSEEKALPVVHASLQAVKGILQAATEQAQQVEAKMVEAKK